MAAELVADCPRCGAKQITFDLAAQNHRYVKYDWQHHFEVFCVCRHCALGTIFVLSAKKSDTKQFLETSGPTKYGGAVNSIMNIEGFVSVKDAAAVPPPEHLPDNIKAAFSEGAKCSAVGCYNAAGTMFRLCVDLATRPLLPPESEEHPRLNAKVRRDLGLRLPWLLDNGRLPEALRELSACIREDGNDGAHAGTLKKEDAADLLDFSVALLERLYTEPKRLELAKERRDERRKGA